ncbi:Uu.00g053070.m01.CDS01 [Anthostomella pinea]|uniref:Uu.00g053070.m01.CDS01 n=1 Tax=Anthostomella pinea TaxID=933095 RepID=A0AAI8VWB1_9PEZI|nr:Uu.00g053070.m01.CDS01 [Anthostomella pinea]
MDRGDEGPYDRVKLEASTGDITAQDGHASSPGNSSVSPSQPGQHRSRADATSSDSDGHDLRGYFETAQWTADGTTLLTYSSTNLISGYIVPSDLLSPKPTTLPLRPQSLIQLSEPSNVLAGAPYFDLATPWTNQLLLSSKDHPIQLFYLTPTSTSTSPSPPPASSYPLTKARAETFLSATSLIWPSPGTHFIAGTSNLLAKFDVSRQGAEPVLRIKTIPSERHLSKGSGVGMRGTVSALGAQPADATTGASLVAAGTWTRWVGLYDFAQAGVCVATWSIAAAAREMAASSTTTSDPNPNPASISNSNSSLNMDPGAGGDGITQTIWSPCGRYLLINERKSRGILVYDVRVTGKLLGYLSQRDTLTNNNNQRINCDVFPAQNGFEVWSGTTDGTVKVWEGVGGREGPHEPAWAWDAHASTVGSTCVHSSGTVVATCSGAWEFPDEEEDGRAGSESSSDPGSEDSEYSDDSESSIEEIPWMRRRNKESSLKIWSIADGQNGDRAGEREGDRVPLE